MASFLNAGFSRDRRADSDDKRAFRGQGPQFVLQAIVLNVLEGGLPCVEIGQVGRADSRFEVFDSVGGCHGVAR